MKIALIAITRNGNALAAGISEGLPEHSVTVYSLAKYADGHQIPFESLRSLSCSVFGEYDALVYLCACGIAVRMIAPSIRSKFTDPAVIAVDEQGHFAVSLLSGHLGGANALAGKIANVIGAVPVITTATDAGRRFSPDCFAAANRLHMVNPPAAKEVAAAIVDGQSVGLRCGYAYINLPPQITPDGQRDTGICISADAAVSPFRTTLHLIPRNVIIGVGCRKNVDSEQFERFIMEKLNENGIPFFRVTALHTIDIKRNEPAIVAFCRKYQLPLRTFTAERLRTAEGSFEGSAFVLRNTGVDNVCERSAAMGGRIIVPKISGSGMTFAAAEQDIIIDFGRDADE